MPKNLAPLTDDSSYDRNVFIKQATDLKWSKSQENKYENQIL